MNALAANIIPARTAPAPLADDAVISATGVAKVFNRDVVALESASFDIKRGTFVSLVGPSGCGKSTLLRLIAGLIGKTSGSLDVLGRQVNGPSPDVGMMFQRPTLLEWRTAVENVLLPTEVRGTPTGADKERAIDLLRLVGLKDFEFAFPRQLSGGMQQRVALARLLQTGAKILLLDEAVRRARRVHPRAAEPRIAAHRRRCRRNHALRHPQHLRGHLPRRPGDGDDAASRPSGQDRRCAVRPSARDLADADAGLQRDGLGSPFHPGRALR